jgi:hypothetical protein
VRSSSGFDLKKSSSSSQNILIGNFNAWQSFEPDDDRLYVNVGEASAKNLPYNHTLPPPPAAKNTLTPCIPPSNASVYSSGRDNYSMFNDEEWAACGMSLGCPSTRSSIAGTRYGSTTYESHSSINTQPNSGDFLASNVKREPIPPSVLQAVLARSAASNHMVREPPSQSVTLNPLNQSNTSGFSSIAVPSGNNTEPSAQQPVSCASPLPTSLFGCSSFTLSSTPQSTHKAGFFYADKGPAPQPPAHPPNHNSVFPVETLAIPSDATSAEDFMSELESRLSLYKAPKEKQQQNPAVVSETASLQLTTTVALESPPSTSNGSSKKSSWFPSLKPPPSISRNRSFPSSSDKKKKQMQVVPPLQPTAPPREDLYGLLSAAAATGGNNDVTREMESMIDSLTQKVRSASREDCKKCLLKHNLDSVSAMKDLQVTQLQKLNIGSKSEIESALRSCNWDLETAASKLLDSKT